MIGCVIAMDSEAEILLDSMEIESIQTALGKTMYSGKAFGQEILLVVCGVGKVNAAAGAALAITKGADIVLNFGVAGGLNASTEVAKIYAIDKAVQYDFDCTQLNGSKVGTLDGETENFLPLYVPKGMEFPRRALGTGDRFNDSVTDHNLLIDLGCDIREMEGCAIVQVCKYAGVPCVSVKAVSDVYGSGSTTEQFRKNLKLALLNLKSRLGDIFKALGE
ncbi:MAG: 5'-methylthioadenosine/S-adenosylhomocysteine nucleosidase [Clostridia bacterium]|nr:5'-methylthioadenosine/S-adenosylhomocysteine nucleosidase [Clostridia bacterium]